MIEKILCLLLGQVQKQDKKLEVQLFLVHLLVLLAGWPRFCLVLVVSALGLTVGLAIGWIESIGGKITINLSR